MTDVLDHDGTPLNVGDRVRYVPDTTDLEERSNTPWTADRNGVVVGIWRDANAYRPVTIHVHSDSSYDGTRPPDPFGNWRDEFMCEPDRLCVTATAHYTRWDGPCPEK